MYIKRHFNIVLIYYMSWRLLLWALFSGGLALFTYEYLDWKWVAIPWLPVSLIGTAVAFYVGFKNNQSYDRSWEARKIWGGIVNLSRSFAAAVRAFVNDDLTPGSISEKQLRALHRQLIYRHLAWLHALKNAMGKRTSWEHEKGANTRARNYFGRRMEHVPFEEELSRYLSPEEAQWVKNKQNAATQLLDLQSQELVRLRKMCLVDDFRHMELQKLITELYGEQGRSERIKNTPLPRQYATSSAIFIYIFTLLLPYGMLSEFNAMGDGLIWLLLPFNLIVSWVFSLMEYIGDYSENPFEGLINDVPIASIVRTIEIDLKEMLEEYPLPERMTPVYDVLF